MQGHATVKLPGEKLVKVVVEYDDTALTVRSVQLCGDFFLHPELGVEHIERFLVGKDPRVPDLEQQLAVFCAERHFTLLGISPESISRALLEALPCFP